MRATVLLFLSVMLLQLSWPCQDMPAVGTPYPADSPSLAGSQSSDDTAVKVDGCSPFCQCACCATPSLTLFMSMIVPPILTHTDVDHILHTCAPTLEISIGIWQPPKLSS